LAERKLWVCGEIRLHIQLHLIGTRHNATGDFSKITRVLSQAEAISQCEEWLHDHMPHVVIEESNDTAGSVRTIVEQDNPELAAIAGEIASPLHGGVLLAGPINDDPANYTRFFILQKQASKNSNANRTSVIITERDTDNVGSLYDALGVFNALGINLTKLDSHTLPGRTRRYAFYIDFDENVNTERAEKVLRDIESLGWDVTVLGTYEKTEH
jgi:prephenate dehydratase